jgi:hypothetical protein
MIVNTKDLMRRDMQKFGHSEQIDNKKPNAQSQLML